MWVNPMQKKSCAGECIVLKEGRDFSFLLIRTPLWLCIQIYYCRIRRIYNWNDGTCNNPMDIYMDFQCCPFVSLLAICFSLYSLFCYCWGMFNNFKLLKTLEYYYMHKHVCIHAKTYAYIFVTPDVFVEIQIIVCLFRLRLHLVTTLREGDVPCEWSLSFQEPKHLHFSPFWYNFLKCTTYFLFCQQKSNYIFFNYLVTSIMEI